jgi:hypothetical protein
LHLQNNAIFNHAAEEENTNVKIKYQEKYNLSKTNNGICPQLFCSCPFAQEICGGWYPELDMIM